MEHLEPETEATWRQWLAPVLGFDLCSLALMRIAVCAAYLWEMARHWKYLAAYCTDNGLLQRSALFEGTAGGWSVYLISGQLEGAQVLNLIHMAAVLALLLGYRTSWSSLLCYIFAYSYQHRFPAIPGWETEIRSLFLLGVFLPWGQRFSLDQRRKAQEPNPTAPVARRLEHFVVSPATIAWRLQIVFLYVASGLAKTGTGWAEGTAVEVSLASDGYATPTGLWLLAQLRQTPQSLETLNFAVPLIEIFTPLLLLFPWPRIQLLAALILCCLHIGFGVCLHIGAFSLICCLCLLCFLPGEIWRRTEEDPATDSGESSEWRFGWGPSVFLAWVSLSMAISVLDNLPEFKGRLLEPARHPWVTLGTEQAWTMFVPPPFEGGWHVIRGKTLQGRWVDLLQPDGRESNEEKPEWVWSIYPGVRGYLFLANNAKFDDPSRKDIHRSIAHHYRTNWENLHPAASDRISEVQIIFHQRKYNPGKGFGPVERNLVHSQTTP